MCIIDEVHQLSLFQVAAVAYHVKFLMMLFDKDQQIEFNQQSNEKGKEIADDENIWYLWPRCIYGGSHMEPWMCMDEANIVASTFSRRFGPEITQFQQAIAMKSLPMHVRNDPFPEEGIWSPVEKKKTFTDKELALVPRTRLRFVKVYNERWDGCDTRGKLLGRPQVIDYQGQPADDSESKEPVYRVAFGPIVFINMIHEGLVFLSQLCAKRVYANKADEAAGKPLPFVPGQQVIISMFYGNDLLFIFTSLLKHVVNEGSYRNLYNIPADVDVFRCWMPGTPDLVSGDTALLSQTAICPRKMDAANLWGNLRCHGRLVVGSTRGRVRISMYLAAECLHGVAPPAWKRFISFLDKVSNDSQKDVSVQEIHVDNGEILAPLRDLEQLTYAEMPVFKALQDVLSNPSGIVWQIRNKHYDLLSRFMRDGTSQIFSQVLSVTENIVRDICGRNDDCEIEEDDDVDLAEIENEMTVKRFTFLEYNDLLKGQLDCIKLIGNLLGTAVYLANDNHGQIVFHVFYPHATDDVIQRINHLGRFFIFLLASVFDNHIAPKTKERIEFRYLPHKRRLLGHRVIRDCHASRTALALTVLGPGEKDEHQMSYTYIGGGVSSDPLHCFGIVCKHMPLETADRLMALLDYVGEVKSPQIYRRQNKSIHGMLDEEQRNKFRIIRKAAIADHVADLEQKFKSKNGLLRKVFQETPANATVCKACDTFFLPCPVCPKELE